MGLSLGARNRERINPAGVTPTSRDLNPAGVAPTSPDLNLAGVAAPTSPDL